MAFKNDKMSPQIHNSLTPSIVQHEKQSTCWLDLSNHRTVSKCIVEYASFQAWHSTHCVLVSAFLFNVSMKNGPKLFSKLCSLLIPRFIVWNFEYRPCPIIENPHGAFQFPCQCAHFSAVHWVLTIIINFAVEVKNEWKCQKFFVTTWLMPVENNRCH